MAQSTQRGHVEHGQFTLQHFYWAGLLLLVVHNLPETNNCSSGADQDQMAIKVYHSSSKSLTHQ